MLWARKKNETSTEAAPSPELALGSKSVPLKAESVDKARSLIQMHKMNDVLGKFFVVRHVKNEPSLNDQKVKVTDIDQRSSDFFDQRVVCKLRGKSRYVSLKQTNLIDVNANVNNAVGTYCMEGHLIKGSISTMSKTQVMKRLNHVITWATKSGENRPDQLYRLRIVKQVIAGDVGEIPCMANPDYGSVSTMNEQECFSACLSALRPGCVGNGFVNFELFNQLICECEEQLVKRFREFIVTGMCHSCQSYYIEQEIEDRSRYGSIFVQCSRARHLGGIRFAGDGWEH